jgi:hypothetical protein
MTDYQGGSGNGLAFYCEPDAVLTSSAYYQQYSNTQLKAVDVVQLKANLGNSLASAEAAPIVNYLKWVLDLALAVAP